MTIKIIKILPHPSQLSGRTYEDWTYLIYVYLYCLHICARVYKCEWSCSMSRDQPTVCLSTVICKCHLLKSLAALPQLAALNVSNMRLFELEMFELEHPECWFCTLVLYQITPKWRKERRSNIETSLDRSLSHCSGDKLLFTKFRGLFPSAGQCPWHDIPLCCTLISADNMWIFT